MIKTGIISSAYFSIDDYKQGIKKLKEHGFNCIDYQNIASPFCEFFKYDNEEFENYFRTIGQYAKEQQIDIFQMHGLWPRYADGDLSGFDRDMELYLKQLHAAELMDCKRFILHPCMPYGWENEIDKEKAFTETLKTIDCLLPYAKKANITICVENMPHSKVHSFSNINELKRLIRTVNDNNVKACFDTGHCQFTQEDIYECIVTLCDDLEALHVHDTFCAQDRHLVPFQGEIDWSKFIKGLKEIKFNGCISLETPISLNTPKTTREKIQILLAEIANWFARQIKN